MLDSTLDRLAQATALSAFCICVVLGSIVVADALGMALAWVGSKVGVI